MNLTTEQMEAIAAVMSGTSIARNGKARKVTSDKKQSKLQASSMADIKASAGNRPVTDTTVDMGNDAMECTAKNGRTYNVYPATFEGIPGHKLTALPFKKSFVSIETLRVLADPDVQVMIAEYVEAYDKA